MASSKPQTSAANPKAELPVLIIGAGLAGLTVALHMAETQPVIVMAKRGLGEAATAWAQGGIVGVVDKEHDSVDSHVADTLDAGAGLVVESTARYIAEESAEAIRWLVEQGVPFTADEEEFVARCLKLYHKGAPLPEEEVVYKAKAVLNQWDKSKWKKGK